MSTQLNIDHDVDQLIDILKEDANIEENSNAMEEFQNLAFAMSVLHTDIGVENLVETTDTHVVITVKVPRL